MPLAIHPYVSPYAPYLRTPTYYLTWLAYYLSYAISPGLVTLLQLAILALEGFLPRFELWIERQRENLRRSQYADERWRRQGRPTAELAEVMGWRTPEWMKSVGRAADVRWVWGWAGERAVGGLRRVGESAGWKPVQGGGAPSPLGPISPPSFAQMPSRPPSLRSRRSTFTLRRERPPLTASAWSAPASVAGSGVSRASNPFTLRNERREHDEDDHDERGSIWSGGEWQAA